MKKILIGMMGAALLATPALAADGLDVTKHREKVSALLAEKAVKWSDVTSVVVEPMYRKGPMTEVVAFVHMRKCDNGYIVVRMDKAANVEQAYARNCPVQGFDTYK